MPPMPPPGGIAGPPAFFFGSSATIASVVIKRLATEAAFWIVVRDRAEWLAALAFATYWYTL